MIRVNGREIKKEVFPNGETRLDLRPLLEDIKVNGQYMFEWKYESDADFTTLRFITDYLKDNGSSWKDKETILNILYMPYSRMDRSENGSVFSLKSAAQLINDLGFDHVIVFEPHSEKTLELLNNGGDILMSLLLLEKGIKYLQQISDLPTYVFYPDKGAKARYIMADQLCLTGAKKRDFDTGRITSYTIENPEDLKHEKFNVVIVDDLTSYGGTFIAASKLLRELGAEKIVLAVTHCEEAAFQGELLQHIDALFTTDSITNQKSFVRKDVIVEIESLFIQKNITQTDKLEETK